MANTTFSSIFNDAAHILYNFRTGRMWHRNLQARFDLHPVVHKIVYRHNERPADWQRLLLEWPHVSIDDSAQIAYTRNEQDAERDRQIRTTIGKYLARHWPHVPDHVRRDWAGSFGQFKFAIWDTPELIIAGVELGPQSCMKSTYGSIPFREDDREELLAWFNDGQPEDNDVDWDSHPYRVYHPHHGWRMAVRIAADRPDVVLGRCLVNDNGKTFVRSYKRNEVDSGYSHTDERLEAWLREQGYSKDSDWSGHKVMRIEHPTDSGPMMPYIDGEVQRATLYADYLRINEDGDYMCNNTNGTVDEEDPIRCHCEDCGEPIRENDDDYLIAGRHEDREVCSCCAENYVEVRAPHAFRSGGTTRYYIPRDDAVEVDGDYYDPDNLHPDVVLCADDEYRLRDDCVECEDGEYRPVDDCVECADGEWRPTDECWQSTNGKWYSNDEPQELREIADNA